MRWSATICWCRDEAYDMVHANEVGVQLSVGSRDGAYDMVHANEVECNYLLVQR